MKNIIYIIIAVFVTSCSTQKVTQNNNIPEKAENISPLLIGETLPNATLQDANGKNFELLELIKVKPTVLVFYRGGWCPYCNLQLSGLAKIEEEILKLNYQIIAISPDDYLNLKNTLENQKVNYQLLSDKNGQLIQKIGIAFQTPLMVKGYVNLKKHEGEMSNLIPVPAVMVINKKGEILFEYINPNYQQRISSEMLLAVLKSL